MPKPSRAAVKASRRLVQERDDDRCMMCGIHLIGRMRSIHHRKPKGMGGSASLERVSNLVTLCGSGTTGCHSRAHQNPQWARNHGWIVSRSFDPAEIPVDMVDGWFLLDDEGGRTPCAPRKAAS